MNGIYFGTSGTNVYLKEARRSGIVIKALAATSQVYYGVS